MSNFLSRAQGVEMGRLPDYMNTFNETASTSAGAIRFRIAMCNLALKHANKRVNGKEASFKTISASKEAFGSLASTLWGLGFQLHSPEGISEKHLCAIIRHKWAYGISVGAFSVLMTQLGKLATWINKPAMLRDKTYYLPEETPENFKRQKVATHSKSVMGNGYDIETVLKNADRIDARFGAMVRMELAFGLRRGEALKIIPHLDDRVVFFDIRKGVAKNGRERQIPIETELQRQTLEYVKSLIRKKEHLGWVDKPKEKVETAGNLLERNEGRYNDYMRQLGFTKKQAGITGHGLRAQYSEDMAIMKGFVPATLGGTAGQLDQESFDLARLQIAENMGHSRLNITGAYYGTLKAKIPNSLGQRLGTIRLQEGRVSTVYINPPVIPKPTGEYARMTVRKLETTQITALIEDLSSDLGVELARLDMKAVIQNLDLKFDAISAVDTSILKRLGGDLLCKFGVVFR